LINTGRWCRGAAKVDFAAHQPQTHERRESYLRLIMAEIMVMRSDRSFFYRGYDVYDRGNVSSGDDAARTGRLFDTPLPGNGNQGHLFGKALNDEEKAAFSNT
jgi:hypothetical protein